MSKIHTEKKDIVGVLYAQGQIYEMLDLLPARSRNLPWLYREHAFEFYVIVEGFASYVIVGHGCFLVVPLISTIKRTVSFLIDDDVNQDDN